MEGDCHYLEGNINARRRVEFIRKILEEIGLEGGRVKMFNVSSAMGAQFAINAAEFTEEIRSYGPNPLREGSSKTTETVKTHS